MTAGDDLDAVYVRLFPKLVGLVSLQCGDPTVAEEIAQETLSRYWERSRSTVIASPEAWTYRVAMNLSNSWWRRRAAERRARRHADTDWMADPTTSTADAVAVRDAVAGLSVRQREAVLLRFYADLSVAETAGVMGCAEGTVKALTHQALAVLGRSGLSVEPGDA